MLNISQRAEKKQVIAKIRELDGTSQEISVYGPQVLEIFKGVSAYVFQQVDNEIGNANADYKGKGWMVRRVRNSPDYGPKLFKSLGR